MDVLIDPQRTHAMYLLIVVLKPFLVFRKKIALYNRGIIHLAWFILKAMNYAYKNNCCNNSTFVCKL